MYRDGNLPVPSEQLPTGQVVGVTEVTHVRAGLREDDVGALFLRLAIRRGGKRAVMAIGRHILQAAYFILRDGVEYRDPGGQRLR